MSTAHRSSERLGAIRSAPDASKAAKLVARIGKGDLKPDEIKKLLGLEGDHKQPPEPDVVKAKISAIEHLNCGDVRRAARGLDEEEYLTLLEKGVPVRVGGQAAIRAPEPSTEAVEGASRCMRRSLRESAQPREIQPRERRAQNGGPCREAGLARGHQSKVGSGGPRNLATGSGVSGSPR